MPTYSLQRVPLSLSLSLYICRDRPHTSRRVSIPIGGGEKGKIKK